MWFQTGRLAIKYALLQALKAQRRSIPLVTNVPRYSQVHSGPLGIGIPGLQLGGPFPNWLSNYPEHGRFTKLPFKYSRLWNCGCIVVCWVA